MTNLKKNRPGSHPAGKGLIAAIAVGLCGALGTMPALAERCDGPPSQEAIDDPRERQWHFCVTVTRNAQDEWTLEGDRKQKEIEVPRGDKARLIFRMDRDLHPDAWLAAVSIARKSGANAPRGEFVGEDHPKSDFGDSRKVVLPGRRASYRVKDFNQIEEEYYYEIWIGTADGDHEVDPGIRNGGSEN